MKPIYIGIDADDIPFLRVPEKGIEEDSLFVNIGYVEETVPDLSGKADRLEKIREEYLEFKCLIKEERAREILGNSDEPKRVWFQSYWKEDERGARVIVPTSEIIHVENINDPVYT